VPALWRWPALLLLVACTGGAPTVKRLNPESIYSSPRHVNVIETRGGRTVFVGGQGPWDASGSLSGLDSARSLRRFSQGSGRRPRSALTMSRVAGLLFKV
jgi:hypothetical protein